MFIFSKTVNTTPPSLMDQPESIPLSSTASIDGCGSSSSSSQTRCPSHAPHAYASASPSPSKLVAVESLPSSQSESSILQTAPVSRLVQSSTMFKPQPSSDRDWCGISRSVQTELTSPSADASLNIQGNAMEIEMKMLMGVYVDHVHKLHIRVVPYGTSVMP